MINLTVQLSKYINLLLIAFYTFYSYYVLGKVEIKKKKGIYGRMIAILYGFNFISYLILYITSMNNKIIFLYLGQFLGITLILIAYQWVYPNISKLILIHMLFLYSIGSVMLTRLDYDKSLKQSIIVGGTLLLCLVVPLIIEKLSILSKFGWIYGGLGVTLLLAVLLFGVEQYGAKNWIQIMGVGFQPSEFVKIIFVFSIASLLSKSKSFKKIVYVTILAAVHVLILVLGKDLGAALIFFITYMVVLYIATKNPWYFFGGLSAGIVASMVAYQLFSHVRVRVMAWSNPWEYIDSGGYQITQSLFAIGTGSWFGMGLSKGEPNRIPIVDSDFIFSAISEEMGALFVIFLIFVLLNVFIAFIMIAMKIENEFYRYIAIGISVISVFQIFLSIGGVIKFIPSTGVTLPLISYGGSSVLSSLFMFSIMQGLYIYSQDRNKKNGKRKDKQQKVIKETRKD